MRFFDAIKLLFPRARAFELFVDNNKRKLIKAFSALPEDIRRAAELVYLDFFPDTTRFLEKWETTFGVIFRENEAEKRRDIIDTLWKINIGGQSALYLEDNLRKIDDAIRVIENIPLRNPFDINTVQWMVCDNETAVCDNKKAVCDYRVRNPLDDDTLVLVCDSEIAVCDHEQAVCDYRSGHIPDAALVLQNDTTKRAAMPDDPRYWGLCVYICKAALRDERGQIIYIEWLEIEKRWQSYIEYLILKIKPCHVTAVMCVRWT